MKARLCLIFLLVLSLVCTVQVPKPVAYGTVSSSIDQWAQQHHILLIGISRDSDDLYYHGSNPALEFDPSNISGFQEAMDSIMRLPDYVLVAMEPQYNSWSNKIEQKAIYFSTYVARGYANSMPPGYGGTFIGCHTGYFLEVSVDWTRLILHEFGHILQDCCIEHEGYGYSPLPQWSAFANDVTQIFNAQGHLISSYARTNPHEDFAESFAYYVWRGSTFRQEAQLYPELEQRYLFLKDHIFNGLEYQDPPIPPTTSLHGEVVDGKGLPIEGAWIHAYNLANPNNGIILLYKTPYTGTFEIQGWTPGQYVFWAEKDGYAKSQLASVTLILGQPVTVTLIEEQATSPFSNLYVDLALIVVVALIVVAVAKKRK